MYLNVYGQTGILPPGEPMGTEPRPEFGEDKEFKLNFFTGPRIILNSVSFFFLRGPHSFISF